MNINDQELKDAFDEYGTIVSAKVKKSIIGKKTQLFEIFLL